ncbi:MAG TPA: hypothetical protein VEQ63_02190 [Bryobacteraceae bacterium]|nr:hypothetical protein [Bryobacteraceae bacterium]
MRNWRLVSGLLLACSVVDAAGILVTRGTDGYEFAEAVAVLVGGKDKALSLGNQPVANGPLNKLPSVKIEGVILRDAASSALLLHEAAGPEYLLPSGLAKTTAPDVAAIWSTAAITYKKAEKDNAPSSVKPESFVAFLPSGTEGVVKLCTDPGSLAIVAGKDKAFAAQIELIRAATKQFGTTPAGPVLQKYVEHSMRDRYDGFEQGLLTVSSIDEGLVFAQLSREI